MIRSVIFWSVVYCFLVVPLASIFSSEVRIVPRQLYLPVGVNQFCRFTSLAWTRCWAALVR